MSLPVVLSLSLPLYPTNDKVILYRPVMYYAPITANAYLPKVKVTHRTDLLQVMLWRQSIPLRGHKSRVGVNFEIR